MKGSIVVLALLSVLACAVYATDVNLCVNPLYERHCAGPATDFFCDFTVVTAPVAKPNTKICPSIAVGSPSCCNQAAYDAIALAWLNARIEIQSSVNALNNAKQGLEIVLNAFQDIINNISNAYPQLTATQQSDLKAAYQSILDSTRNYLNIAVSDWANCAEALLAYWAGMVCFRCDPTWNLYVSVDNSTDVVTVLLDKYTCTAVTGQCITFFDDLATYVESVLNAAETIGQIISTGSGTVQPIDGTVDLCNGDCPNYICYGFIAGLQYRNPTSNEGSEGISGSTATAGRRAIAASEVLESRVVDTLNAGMRGFGDKFHFGLSAFEKAISNAKEVNQRITKSVYGGEESKRQTSSSSVVNKYDQGNGGYTAYNNGKSSGLDTSVSGGSSVMWSWMSLFF